MKIGLAVNAGGLRGIVAIIYLKYLFSRAHKAPYEVFDIISGASTGSIICALLAKNISPAEIEKAYYDLGLKVFPSSFLSLGFLKQIVSSRYDINNLEKLLDGLLKGSKMKEALVPVMIPAVNADIVGAEHFKSYVDWWKEFPLSHAATASSSAQSFFNAFQTKHNGISQRWLDGGNFAGNPSDDLLSEMQCLWPNEEHVIINLGVGRLTKDARQPIKDGGFVTQGPQLFRASSEPQDDNATKKCQRRIGDNFIFLDVELDKIPAMNDARVQTLDHLRDKAKASIVTQQAKIDRILDLLNSK